MLDNSSTNGELSESTRSLLTAVLLAVLGLGMITFIPQFKDEAEVDHKSNEEHYQSDKLVKNL